LKLLNRIDKAVRLIPPSWGIVVIPGLLWGAAWLLNELLDLVFKPDPSLGIAPGAGLLMLLLVGVFTVRALITDPSRGR
jgi:hypothetical protein